VPLQFDDYKHMWDFTLRFKGKNKPNIWPKGEGIPKSKIKYKSIKEKIVHSSNAARLFSKGYIFQNTYPNWVIPKSQEMKGLLHSQTPSLWRDKPSEGQLVLAVNSADSS